LSENEKEGIKLLKEIKETLENLKPKAEQPLTANYTPCPECQSLVYIPHLGEHYTKQHPKIMEKTIETIKKVIDLEHVENCPECLEKLSKSEKVKEKGWVISKYEPKKEEKREARFPF